MNQPMKPKRRRGAFTRDECQFVGVWVPQSWLTQIDRAVNSMDIDRSKFFRAALAAKIGGGR